MLQKENGQPRSWILLAFRKFWSLGNENWKLFEHRAHDKPEIQGPFVQHWHVQTPLKRITSFKVLQWKILPLDAWRGTRCLKNPIRCLATKFIETRLPNIVHWTREIIIRVEWALNLRLVYFLEYTEWERWNYLNWRCRKIKGTKIGSKQPN